MPFHKPFRRALHSLNPTPKSINSPPPLFPSPPDAFLVGKALSILERHHLSLLDPLIPQFTPQSAAYLLLQSQSDKTLIQRFLNWARELPFFRNSVQCHCLSIHILTKFKLYKIAQSVAEEAASVFPDWKEGDLIFSCLRETYYTCNSSSAVFDLIVKAFSNSRLIDRALNVIALAKCHGFMPGVLAYNSVLEAIIRRSGHGDIELAKNMYVDMMKSGVSPNVFTYNILIRGFCANKEMDRCLVFLEEMEKKGCLPNVVTYNTLIDGYCKMGDIERAYTFLELMWEKHLEPNVITYNVIINGLCREGRMRETSKVLEEMSGEGLVPDEITYNTLVNGYCKEGNFHRALALLAEMVRNGLSPNVVTYTSLINSMCKAGNLHRAMEFFDQMHVRGLKPNEKTYTTLINGFSQQGFMDEALRLLREMISMRFSPSLVTFNSLINGFCVLGRIDDGFKMIEDMIAQGIHPDVVSFSTIISGLCRNFDLDKAFAMKEEMINKGISPDAITYSSLIQGLCGQRRLDEAYELFQEMSKVGLPPDKCTYTSLINACCVEDDLRNAIRLHDEMINKGFFPDIVTYSVLINGLNKHTRSKEAKRLLLKLPFEQSIPDGNEFTIDMLVDSCSKIEFRNGAALIKGLCMKGLPNDADRVFQAMLQKNHKPSEAVYNVLIHGHCRAGKLQRAIGLYREMAQHEYVAYATTVIAMTKELYKEGRNKELGQILQGTMRSCKIIDGDPAKVLLDVNYREGNMNAVLNILSGMAKDGLLPDESVKENITRR